MMKFILLTVLALVASVSAQGEAPATAEPYSYGYQTDSHGASEQRDPSGKVTGFYTISDSDGRQRRVDYYADETGFHAKVQTNEVGTKSENPADVEVLASPPNQEQYASYQSAQAAQAPAQAPAPVQQAVAPAVSNAQQSRYVSQQYTTQPGYGYYQPGYQYGYTGGNYGYGANNYYSVAPSSSSGYYSSYNNHLPSQYYRSIQATPTTRVSQQSGYSVGSSGVSQPVAYSALGFGSGSGGVSTSSSSSGVPTSSVYRSYSSSSRSGPVGYQTVGVNPPGSSNYIVLKKRESAQQQYAKSK